MSQVAIRKALEIALNAMTPALPTAWENVTFQPPDPALPFQRVFILFAEPDDAELGSANHTERGIFQINLLYPLQAGDKDARARAELIKSTFARANSFSNSGISTIIERTPEASGGMVDGDRWLVPVKCRFFAFV